MQYTGVHVCVCLYCIPYACVRAPLMYKCSFPKCWRIKLQAKLHALTIASTGQAELNNII